MALSTLAKFIWPIPDKGLVKRLHRTKASTLVVLSSEDLLVPPVHGDVFVSLIGNSQFHIIDGGGHLSHLERTEEFACVVKEFLL